MATETLPLTTLETATTQELYRELIRRVGEDPERDGLLRTPERMEKSMAFFDLMATTRRSPRCFTTRSSTWITTRW